ncbi:hypothetical protein UFOVP231_2 [uncultured Caudovirales phage]|uniref:DUF551 domain-containing protein n=1 Tax=uncultured Caudovirales phage TaxID=2100421 RepID=A0A6J7WQ33_9CAUD|nr:hypothetical protein UFOVP231_2 [uncultured Caudovirales phage]
MDYVEKLESITVVRFTLGLYEKPYENLKLRAAAFLNRAYSPDQTLWNVVVDGPQYWVTHAGIGPKVIETLADAINAEIGAKVVDVVVPAKRVREQGYYWTNERLQKANAMMDGGMSRNAVAKAHGKSSDGLKAALRRYKMEKPRAKGQWHPIETAPKDRYILVTGGNGLRIDQVMWGGWELDDTHNWCDLNGNRHPNAAVTHWMLLPPPPKQ